MYKQDSFSSRMDKTIKLYDNFRLIKEFTLLKAESIINNYDSLTDEEKSQLELNASILMNAIKTRKLHDDEIMFLNNYNIIFETEVKKDVRNLTLNDYGKAKLIFEASNNNLIYGFSIDDIISNLDHQLDKIVEKIKINEQLSMDDINFFEETSLFFCKNFILETEDVEKISLYVDYLKTHNFNQIDARSQLIVFYNLVHQEFQEKGVKDYYIEFVREKDAVASYRYEYNKNDGRLIHVMSFNESYLDTPDYNEKLFYLGIATVFHELEHFNQKLDTLMGEEKNCALLNAKEMVVLNYDKSFYNEYYYSFNIEHEALFKSLERGRKFVGEKLKDKYDKYYYEWYSDFISKANFNQEYLDLLEFKFNEALLKHPEVLEKFPVLNQSVSKPKTF